MKKILIIYPDGSERIFTFEELGLDENSTEEEITKIVDEEVMQNISWGHEIIED